MSYTTPPRGITNNITIAFIPLSNCLYETSPAGNAHCVYNTSGHFHTLFMFVSV